MLTPQSLPCKIMDHNPYGLAIPDLDVIYGDDVLPTRHAYPDLPPAMLVLTQKLKSVGVSASGPWPPELWSARLQRATRALLGIIIATSVATT